MSTSQSTNKTVKRTDRARIERALTEFFAVSRIGPGVYRVASGSSSEYVVDLREARCTCPDYEDAAKWCKHLLRVCFETGRGIPGQCSDCAELNGDFPCADCAIEGFAAIPETDE